MKETAAIVLLISALLSPVLTVLRLLQIKEWRWDRLKEHLVKEGFFLQLFGKLRPSIFLLWTLCSVLMLMITSDQAAMANPLGFLLLILFSGLSIIRVLANHQPMPVWTLKAKTVLALTVTLSILIAIACLLLSPTFGVAGTGITAFLSPLLVVTALIILQPVDSMLKTRILTQAERMRTAHPKLRVIGITGSVGKTTTKVLLSHILQNSRALTTPEHVNTEMGVAAWLTQILKNEPEDSKRILIVEMGAYCKGEIALLCKITKPTYGIITYIGDQHLALFGSREAIIRAKGELFAALPENGRAFANSDNDAYQELVKLCRSPVTTVGTGQHANIQAIDIEETAQGLKFRALGTQFEVPITGTHSIAAILLAIALSKEIGMTPVRIAQRLKTFRSIKNTFEVKIIGSITILDDTYNSSPESVKAAIEWARRQPQTTKILVMEGIIELGASEEKIHTEIARLASDIFTEAYIAHPRYKPYFTAAFGSRVHLVIDGSAVRAGSLLVLSGRLSADNIKRFVPMQPETIRQ